MSERDVPSTQVPDHDLPAPDDPRADEVRPENVMGRRHAILGSARGIGSVGYDDAGAFDVGAGEARDDAGTSDRSEPRSFAPRGRHDASSGSLETGGEFQSGAELADRDPGDGAGRLSPENARPEGDEAEAAERWAQGLLDDASRPATAVPVTNEQADARRMHGDAASSGDADEAPRPDETRGTANRGSIDTSDGL